jgi:hypothetical protein
MKGNRESQTRWPKWDAYRMAPAQADETGGPTVIELLLPGGTLFALILLISPQRRVERCTNAGGLPAILFETGPADGTWYAIWRRSTPVKACRVEQLTRGRMLPLSVRNVCRRLTGSGSTRIARTDDAAPEPSRSIP